MQIDYIDLEPQDLPSVYVEQFAQWTMDEDEGYDPHRHNFQEIIWFEAGTGSHTIDGQLITITPQTLCLIGKGQVHRFETTTDLTGHMIRFSDDFLQPLVVAGDWDYMALFNGLGHSEPLLIPAPALNDFATLFKLIETEYEQVDAFGKYTTLRHLTYTLLIKIEQLNRMAALPGQPAHATDHTIYQAFLDALESEYRRQHDVDYYARLLQLSRSHLARLLQQQVGKGAKQLIRERILLEAKRYLQFTPLSVKEIAFALGYSDPFHFSKVFKQTVGLAPQVYRAQRQKMT
ncbi:MAG: AraC family transcriptional regulator [Chloroflexota bacterium]|nr:AraC family transcriptional regulator [Chloroflexota bacterium]